VFPEVVYNIPVMLTAMVTVSGRTTSLLAGRMHMDL